MIRVLILLLAFAGAANAEEIVLGLSRDQVNITATFDGSDILIFGAVKRDAPAPDDSSLEVIVAIAGPDDQVQVRRKERRYGIWINTDSAKIDAAPSFYAVATTAPLSEILTEAEDLRHQITVNRTIRAVTAPLPGDEERTFTQALIRIRQSTGLYQLHEGAVDLENDTLFSTAIELPANLTEGSYTARIFLTRDGAIVDTYETEIPVAKVGLERWLYNLAQEQAMLYGLLSLFIAIAAGWGASAIFQGIRR